MHLDTNTIDDLSILKGEQSLYKLLAKCETNEGNELIWQRLQHPYTKIDDIIAFQHSLMFWYHEGDAFKFQLTNGTMMMVQQFLHSNEFVEHQNLDIALHINTWIKRIIQKDSLQHVNFLTEQLSLLIKDAYQLLEIFQGAKQEIPALLHEDFLNLKLVFEQPAIITYLDPLASLSEAKKIAMIHNIKRYGKSGLVHIISILAKIDVLQSLVRLMKVSGWTLPVFEYDDIMVWDAIGLFHPLVEAAKPYDINFDEQQHFLILTGANMSGKSTFMRTVGVSAILAHCGYPVPASSLRLSFFDTIITQINIQDDIAKGESYFYAEVLRIKQTAQRMQANGRNLVILDELFKGTNVHDAYDCSCAVVHGLANKSNNLILLSTHLHELADKTLNNQGIFYKYFETLIHQDKSFRFTYKLMDGVSKDRIGYALLVQEGVIDLLN